MVPCLSILWWWIPSLRLKCSKSMVLNKHWLTNKSWCNIRLHWYVLWSCRLSPQRVASSQPLFYWSSPRTTCIRHNQSPTGEWRYTKSRDISKFLQKGSSTHIVTGRSFRSVSASLDFFSLYGGKQGSLSNYNEQSHTFTWTRQKYWVWI